MLAVTRSWVNYSLLNKGLHGVSTVDQAFIPIWHTIRNDRPSILATSVWWRFSLVACGCYTWSMVATGKKLRLAFFAYQLSNILISSPIRQRYVLPSVNIVKQPARGTLTLRGNQSGISHPSWYPLPFSSSSYRITHRNKQANLDQPRPFWYRFAGLWLTLVSS